MSKNNKKNGQQRPVAFDKQTANIAASGNKSESRSEGVLSPLNRAPSEKYFIPLFFIVLISFIAFSPSLENGFVWDDGGYLLSNALVRSVNLSEIFSGYVMGNYHPLTMLTYAIEYHFFGLDAHGYHNINLLLHLLNVILVFYGVFLLSNKTDVALVASLLFGIHPVHVESVAWASGLKDLLYTFFFLAAYIYYLKYLQQAQRKFYFFALFLFLLSLLSKGMAVSLPVVLLLTDYFKDRKINRQVWLEKAPFFILALILGVVAILAQGSADVSDVNFYSFPQRLIFASHSVITYLLKLLLPLHLSAYYPYPVKSGASVPFQYYAYMLLFLGLAVYVFYSLRFSKKIAFGIGFFFVTIFLVLQLLPIGGALMADRYCYLPSIGIFYLAGEELVLLLNKKGAGNSIKIPVAAVFSIAIIFFFIKTYSQCSVWQNNFTLWNNVISHNSSIPLAYHNRGLFFAEQHKDEDAISDFSRAIALKPDYVAAYNNRGLRFEHEKKYEDALNDFNKAILLSPEHIESYNNRGIVFNDLGRYDEALNDFNKAIALNPGYFKSYNNRGMVMMNLKKQDEALNDFNKTIELNPDYFEAYYNRGILLMNEKRYEEASNDFNKSIELQPDYAPAYYNRGVSEYDLGEKDLSCLDFQQAGILGFHEADEAYSNFCH